MKQVGIVNDELKFAATIGLDWADQKHAVYLLEAGSSTPEYMIIKHSPEDIIEWMNQLRKRFGEQKIAICLEQSKRALINALINYDFLVLYPVNPATLARYRQAFAASGAKNDPGDAYYLMELVTAHRDKLKAWKPDNELTRSISIIVESRHKAVKLRTRLVNMLRAMLKSYFPQALDLVGSTLHSTLACDFILNWPTLEDIKKEEKQTIRRFYYGHHSRRGDLIEKRLNIIEQSCPLTSDQAIIKSSLIMAKMLAGQLRVLANSIREYDNKLATLFSQHPDSIIFSSLPGAGAVLAPRLLAAFGTDRDRFDSAEDIQKYSGIAPVIVRSGNSIWIHWRYACSKFIRQSFHEFANRSIHYSMWAKVYYEKQRQKGKGHHTTIRSLAFKWIRIIFRCWKNREAYDEVKYLKALQQSGSLLLNCA